MLISSLVMMTGYFCMLLSETTGLPFWIRRTEVSVILPWICRPCSVINWNAIKNSNVISFLKLRLGYAGTGNVSLDGYQRLGVMGNIAGGTNTADPQLALPNFGAYVIYPTTIVGTGFPFGTTNGFSQSYISCATGFKA